MTNNKQRSVEWFANKSWQLKVQLDNQEISVDEYAVSYVRLLYKAKAMHKEEIKNAFTNGFISHLGSNRIADETFYNETFGGNNDQQ